MKTSKNDLNLWPTFPLLSPRKFVYEYPLVVIMSVKCYLFHYLFFMNIRKHFHGFKFRVQFFSFSFSCQCGTYHSKAHLLILQKTNQKKDHFEFIWYLSFFASAQVRVWNIVSKWMNTKIKYFYVLYFCV